MDESTQQRCITVAHYMLENRSTIRRAAGKFGLSKSSVHKDMCQRLLRIDTKLASEVAALLEYNKSVRHLRGGEATRRRFMEMRNSELNIGDLHSMPDTL